MNSLAHKPSINACMYMTRDRTQLKEPKLP